MRCPIEVVTGFVPRTPLEQVFWQGNQLASAVRHGSEPERIERCISRLKKTLDEAHSNIQRGNEIRRQRRRAMQDGTPEFEVGDLVMVARRTRLPHKLAARWMGPYEVVTVESPYVLKVRIIGSDDTPVAAHIQRVKRFAGREFEAPADLVALAQRDAQEFEVEAIINHQWDDGELLFLVHWYGFEDEDRTWEPSETLAEDVPVLVRRYIQDHQLYDDQFEDLRRQVGAD